jgi:hypothetical protein
MADKMTSEDFRKLEILLRKARFDESQNINQHSMDMLQNVEIWASRRVG